MRAALALATAVALAGCFTAVDGASCRVDDDCPGATCTRVGECASDTYALRITWTVRGQPANTPGACDGIGELQVAIEDPSTGGEHALRPVPCAAGSFFFDKLPLGYTAVTVTAYSGRGGFLTSTRGSAIGSEGTVSVDLAP